MKGRAQIWGVRAGNLARLNLYFLSAATFDILRNLGYAWASYGLQISSGFIFALIGLIAANLYFCPESNSIKETWMILKSRLSLMIYEVMVVVWVALNIFLPSPYIEYTVIMLLAVAIYPTVLFRAARARAKPTHVKNALATISITWFLFITLSTLLFALGSQPPALPVSIPYAWEIAFVTGSILFFLMSFTEANPLGSVKFPTGQLIPDTVVKPGHRYLILHDSGRRAVTFLTSTMRDLIDSGSRVIITPPISGWLLASISQKEPRFDEWKKSGRIIVSDAESESTAQREGISERLSFGPLNKVYLREIDKEDLRAPAEVETETTDRQHKSGELLLLESSKAPRPQLTAFLRRDTGIELLNLSESTDTFSALFNLDHQQLRGSAILFEYDNSSGYEAAVEKFFSEASGNAELCVLFTTKSSKLYRAIKGNRMIKIIAASSLISAPDELPDGEMQIPDKELGLVAAMVSDFLDNSKNSGASFVFDSLMDLIRGERWEQVYAGVRQLIDLLTVPNATAVFLANVDTMEPRFIGALRGLFAVQIKMDSSGLRAVKVPTRKRATSPSP